MSEPEKIPTDARGIPIEIGRTCIYGAPVGRSIALVEAVVEGFTKSGRVNVRPVRRAYGSSAGYSSFGTREVVHVGCDRLTIVDQLPASPYATEAEKAEKARVERAERDRLEATHDIPTWEEWEALHPIDRTGWTITQRPHRTCRRCGLQVHEAWKVECAA